MNFKADQGKSNHWREWREEMRSHRRSWKMNRRARSSSEMGAITKGPRDSWSNRGDGLDDEAAEVEEVEFGHG